jgi:hypothetical protein
MRLYGEYAENQENPSDGDKSMASLESLINARRRGLMTQTEYWFNRDRLEKEIFSVQLAKEKRIADVFEDEYSAEDDYHGE